MKQYLIVSREVFNKLLKGYSPNPKFAIQEFINNNLILDSYDFKKWYDDNNMRYSTLVIQGYALSVDYQQLPEKILNEVVLTDWYAYISANQMLYYILTYVESDFTNILDGIKITIDGENKYNQFIKKTLNSLDMFESLDKDILSFYPALKWFYSNETKHLYPKDLLKQMKDYEKELDKIKTEDCFREANKWDRLIKM
ncbi:MAG: hypothetical protein ACP5N1_02070 [Candidatus Woesearchaeota archaeon]